MKKLYSLMAAFTAITMLMTACSSATPAASSAAPAASGSASSQAAGTDSAQPNLIGDNLKYDLNAPVNNGEKISLTIWTDPEIKPFFEEGTQKYMKIHPNVSFNIVEQPWDDYWTKLPLALSTGSGPDLYRSHHGFINNLKQYSRPLDTTVFPMDQLAADFPSINEMDVDGNIYSVPLGFTFGAGIYYNKGMWKEAGLTEADIPTTWDKFVEVGKKMTKTDDKGNITQYGLSIDHAFENFIVDLNYQKGYALFKDDLSTWNFAHDGTYENIEMVRSFKDTDKFMMYSDGDCEDQFGHGQAAMMYNMSWVGGYFNDVYPEIDWGYFIMPTKDGKTAPAYGQKMNEWTMSVSSADDKKAAVAFDFMKYYLCEGQTLLEQAIRISVVPAKVGLQNDPKVNEYENLREAAKVADRLVYAGVIPTSEKQQKGMRAAGSDIFVNGKKPQEVIEKLVADLTDTAAKNNFTIKSKQDQYAHYDELKK